MPVRPLTLAPLALWTVLAACSGSTPAPAPEAAAPPAPAPEPAAPPAPAAETRTLSLDAPGGLNGAPEGLNFIVPDPKGAEAKAGALSDGSTGFTLTARNPGDAVVCTQAVRMQPSVTFKSRLHVVDIKPGAQPWMGLNVELRARDDAGNLVSPPGGRYTLLQNVREAGAFVDLENAASLPTGATKGELCVRFVESRGTVEVDSIAITGALPDVAEAPVVVDIPAPTTRFELDQPGGGSGAPMGADFYIPPGIAGVSTRVGALENSAASGFAFTVSQPGNALACSQAFPVTAGGSMWAQGNVRVRDISADPRPFAGFTAEVRSYDATNALVSPPGSQFTSIQVWKAPTPDFAAFGKEFTVPAKAATAKICLRFAETTGAADVDWLGITVQGAPAVVDAAAPAAPAAP